VTHPNLISDQLSELCLTQAEKEYRRQISDASSTMLSFEDRLEMTLNVELQGRSQRRIERRIKEANLRIRAVPEEIDKKSARGLSEVLLSQLLGIGWLRNHPHVLGASNRGRKDIPCLRSWYGSDTGQCHGSLLQVLYPARADRNRL